MKINRNNYEAYFIDYMEGNLDVKLVDDFLEFLLLNPDLKEELSLFQSVSLEPEEIQFNKKERLYKNKFDLEDNFNHSSVALLEGDLSKDERAAFEDYINSHPEKKKEFQLFEKTKLQPDLSVRYDRKSSLYHRSTGRSVIMWSTRIAAVIIFAITFYVLVDQYSGNKLEEPKVAVIETVTQQNEIQSKDASREVNQQVVIPDKETEKPEVKQENKSTEPQIIKPAQNDTKSIRENAIGRMDETDIVIARVPVESISTMVSLAASVEINHPQESLRKMHYILPEETPYQDDERFLAEEVVEKTGISKLSFNKIAKAGLHIVSNISKDKLTYETNESGKVTEINYDSRLLAFSIPTKGETGK